MIFSLPPKAFVNAKEFEVEYKCHVLIAYILNITDMKKSLDNSLAIADPVSITEKYTYLVWVFSDGATNILPAYRNQDLSLKISGTLFFVLLYNLSQTELKVLFDNILDNFAKWFIQSSTSSTGAFVLFVNKKMVLYGYLSIIIY